MIIRRNFDSSASGKSQGVQNSNTSVSSESSHMGRQQKKRKIETTDCSLAKLWPGHVSNPILAKLVRYDTVGLGEGFYESDAAFFDKFKQKMSCTLGFVCLSDADRPIWPLVDRSKPDEWLELLNM